MTKTTEIEVPRVFRPLLGRARYKGAHGGRGSGKSHFFAGLMIARAATEPGFRAVCIREVQRSIADSVKRLLEDKIAAHGLGALFEITSTEIRTPGGGVIIFRGMQNHTADSIKSLEGFDVAWIEEAQSISQRSLDLLIPTIRKPGSEIWASWNPESQDNPIDVLLRRDTPQDAVVVEANWWSNPFFPDVLREEMERCKRRDPDKYAHIWEGQYVSLSEARVFRNFREGEVEVPADATWLYGVDWGFAQDPTAAVRCCILGEALYIDHEAYEIGVPMEGLPALLAQVPGITKWPVRADSARPETIDYCRRHGIPGMRGARKGKGSVEAGVDFIRSFDVVIHPRCVNTMREFRLYSYKTDAKTGEVLPVIKDERNHAIDALRYALEGASRPEIRVRTL